MLQYSDDIELIITQSCITSESNLVCELYSEPSSEMAGIKQAPQRSKARQRGAKSGQVILVFPYQGEITDKFSYTWKQRQKLC